MGRFTFAVAFLLLTSLPAAALDPKVASELERLANRPANQMRDLAVRLQNELFNAIETSCREQQETTPEQCELSRLIAVLDRDGILRERCGSLTDGDAVSVCVIAGAETLPIVAALGGDPRKDFDWTKASNSYLRWREALKDFARRRCTSSDGINAECVVKEQAAQLGFPPAAGLGCAEQPGKYDKQGCLDALQTIAIYLSAIGRLLDDSRPL